MPLTFRAIPMIKQFMLYRTATYLSVHTPDVTFQHIFRCLVAKNGAAGVAGQVASVAFPTLNGHTEIGTHSPVRLIVHVNCGLLKQTLQLSSKRSITLLAKGWKLISDRSIAATHCFPRVLKSCCEDIRFYDAQDRLNTEPDKGVAVTRAVSFLRMTAKAEMQ